jgi:hypothetical protein
MPGCMVCSTSRVFHRPGNPALCLAWYITASFGWRATWDDIDIPCLIAAANVCDEIMGTRAGTAERRYTCNGTLSLAEGKIAITEKLVAAMAGALVVSGGRFFIHAGGPALPVATLTSDDLRGDVTIQGSRARRDLFNGVRAVYVEPSANWQPTDAPPLPASNYVAEDGGVDLVLAEEDSAVWDWNPAVDERATGDSPSVVLPNPGRISAPASITVGTPVISSFAALAVTWSAVGSAYLAGYEIEFLPASIAVWQGYGAGFGATAASIPTAESTGFRARAVARSGAVSGWREALVPAAVSAPTATGIAGGVRLSGGFPADAVRLQVFEASSASLAAAMKLATEPTALFWDRTGLTAGQTRWYWLRSVSAEGNVSVFVGPVTATAL